MNSGTDNPVSWRARAYRAAVASALVAGAFGAVVGAVMAWDCARIAQLDPLNSPQLRSLKDALALDSGNGAIKQQIRQLDQEVRREFAARRARIDSGRYLLLCGVVAMLLACTVAVAVSNRQPLPDKADFEHLSSAARRRMMGGFSVAAVAVIFGVLALLAKRGSWNADYASWRPETQDATSVIGSTKPGVSPFASDQEMQRNWPRFYGPFGTGLARRGEYPMSFNAKTRQGIAWKTPVPLGGMSSPIVWGDRIFVTGATKDKHEIYCFDAGSGKMFWRREVQTNTPVPADASAPSDMTGYAASTPATDGRSVYAIFADGDLACLDFEGKVVWSKNLGYPRNAYGHAASLLTYKDKLIVPYDQGTVDDGLSALLVLRGATGEEVQRLSRQVDSSWTTPIILTGTSPAQLVTASKPWIIAYDPDSLQELWRAQWLSSSSDVAPSPTFTGGMVVVANSPGKMVAIKPQGRGDLTGSIAWTVKDGLPDIVSPLGFVDMVLTINDSRELTCRSAIDGKQIWRKQVESDFSSSPVYVPPDAAKALPGRIYMFDRDGVACILQAGRQFKQLGRGELGEKCFASPAMVDGRIYVRTDQSLFCIGKSK